MRQTLFHIPHELFGQQVFGFGWALIVWAVVAVVIVGRQVKRSGWSAETTGSLPMLAIIGAAIAFGLPMLEAKDAGGAVIGLPIRGYGVMLMLGIVLGVGAAAYRAQREGIDPEHIFSLALWMGVSGIVGARLLFIVLYWEQFRGDTWGQTILAMFKFTEGGLVVYGSLIGGVLAALFYLRNNKLPPLAMADIVAPCLLLGLAVGRIGCLLNGCCYGGVCEGNLPSIAFPRYNNTFSRTESPPYAHQRGLGMLHGIRIAADEKTRRPIIAGLTPTGPAAQSGIAAGETIVAINGIPVDKLLDARVSLLSSDPRVVIETESGEFSWTIGALPPNSLPVHPTQIYSAINAILLFWLLWIYFPFRRHDGEVFAAFLVIYPITRFLLEAIRNDEPGRFGTGLTVSQLISLLLVAAGAALLIRLTTRPGGRTGRSAALAGAEH